MASGKTAVGRELARRLRTRFLDTDALVVDAHGPIPEIFAAHGEPGFRDYESEALLEAAERTDRGGGVVATGGGAVLSPGNRELLKGRFTVYLSSDAETVLPRISNPSTRPLLAGDPVQRWLEIYEVRRPFYAECATLVVDAREGTPAQIAAQIADAYRRRTSTPGGTTA
ncbi:shikimate kinase [Zafaria sp. Z1313]|uniref:shikimate kinase n=1 Tax=unclassified Zafaria TaxID=2828765 RepID=UPI002E7621A8|nr:shikimate kinase [Zafaria sp. J156]MEE1621122.1 shikimate kinase [Zafaria sp. J156]